MNSLKISQKIRIGSGLIAGSFLLQAGFMAVMDHSMGSASDQEVLMAQALHNHMQADMMHDAIRGSVYRIFNLSGLHETARMADAQKEVAEYSQQMRTMVAANRKLPLDTATEADLGHVDALLATYTDTAQEIARQVAVDPEGAQASLPKFEITFHELETAQDAVADRLEAKMAEAKQEGSSAAAAVMWGLAFVSIAFLALLGWAARYLGKTVVQPVDRLSSQLDRMTGGDYAVEIEVSRGDDEIGAIQKAAAAFRDAGLAKQEAEREQERVVLVLADNLSALSEGDLTRTIDEQFSTSYEPLRVAFNQSVDRLSGLMKAVTASADSVSTGANEIRAASGDLAQRNEEQAARLEETAASMNQVTTMVESSARGAAEVGKVAASAHLEASEGGAVVRKAIDAMSQIQSGSHSIASIVDVIDGIAFQTNLLALNAGVEAARAGESGKGFAVVANEVRALAQRSAEAAKDIKQLVTTSNDHVATGVALVDESGRAFTTIVDRVGAITESIEAIASSAVNQAENLKDVNEAVGQMDRMTQQNAAMVEQSTAASGSLASEANELTRLVSQFRVAGANHVVQLPAKAASHRRSPASAPRRVVGNLARKPASGIEEDWTEF